LEVINIKLAYHQSQRRNQPKSERSADPPVLQVRQGGADPKPPNYHLPSSPAVSQNLPRPLTAPGKNPKSRSKAEIPARRDNLIMQNKPCAKLSWCNSAGFILPGQRLAARPE